ncbi:CaiB/BaiF CoA-transferase family protein [Spongiibacter tropicus]|uniref:CaiB/BaiF CoA-transferase family protein n=1 Tax=Spongiibacter tropicus TaxID=454602 RepID=UPI0003B69967|nr:CoA transferase [Spongiibacter tropicus]
MKMGDGVDSLPLAGTLVVDLLDGQAESCGRLLADLGADVVLVEPPEGLNSRRQPPLHNGESLHFAVRNANKSSVVMTLDNDEGRQEFSELLSRAAIVLDGGRLAGTGIALSELRNRFPHLVIMSITDFGLTGPWRDYRGNNSVMMALGGVLARSGIRGRDPLLPPGELAIEAAAIQAAWAVMLAYWRRLHTGQGSLLDFSLLEATAQTIDPGLGVTGSAAAGRSAAQVSSFGRPPVGKVYPIFPCRDGHVRICVLNPRQWQGMSQWLGDDHPFTDPEYGNIAKRIKVIKDINALIAELFREQCAEELVAEGQRRGVPIAAVSTPDQVFSNGHFRARGAFTSVEIGGDSADVPSGYVEIDGRRMGIRHPAPTLGECRPIRRAPVGPADVTGVPSQSPLSGLRVLDLGVIVAGAELGRLFADQGAEVIKLENRAFADGLRQSADGKLISESFAQGSRNKKSLGLNLRSKEGIALFEQLVAKSDVVLSNFKPGTLESLGIGYDRLSAINPRIVVLESSALGNTGPLAKSMGYGPLVRASAGLTGLWSYPGVPDSYSDSTTIFPDHFVARVAAVAILAQLLRRRDSGRGGKIVLSQAEAILNAMAVPLARESLQPGSLKVQGNQYEFDAPANVFPCKGDDMWCVVEVRSDRDWQALCQVLGRDDWASLAAYANAEGRRAQREALEAEVAQWTCQHTADEVMARMQAAGIAAGKMLRLSEFGDVAHLRERRFFREFEQPGLGRLVTENSPAGISDLPEPALQPAPIQGQHTRELASRLLGLSAVEIEHLIGRGVLEVASDEQLAQAGLM